MYDDWQGCLKRRSQIRGKALALIDSISLAPFLYPWVPSLATAEPKQKIFLQCLWCSLVLWYNNEQIFLDFYAMEEVTSCRSSGGSPATCSTRCRPSWSPVETNLIIIIFLQPPGPERCVRIRPWPMYPFAQSDTPMPWYPAQKTLWSICRHGD